MKVLITGGLGFLGRRLAQAILDRGTLITADGTEQTVENVVLFDHAVPDVAPFADDMRVQIFIGDISDRTVVFSLVDQAGMSIFHLASIVSGEGETNFDGAIRVNLDGGLNVLEAARTVGGPCKIVATSSLAGFGGQLPEVVGDTTRLVPQTTYGTTKVILELLINDYSRKGFLDGRTARLPTVIVRPGQPNAAASSFFSGVFREPLRGVTCALPVEPSQLAAVTGYRSVIRDLMILHDLSADQLGHDRTLGFPALNISVQDMLDALEHVGGAEARDLVSVEADPTVQAIVSTWPTALEARRALSLGLTHEQSLYEIVSDYMEDYGLVARNGE